MTKAKSRDKSAPFPAKAEILDYIRDHPGRAGRRAIARAVRRDGRQKAALKEVLAELEAEGAIPRRRRSRRPPGLPSVALVEITGTDTDGEVLARPVNWDSDARPPFIYMDPARRFGGAPGPGDRMLARLKPAPDGTYEGRTMRRIPAAAPLVLGIYTVTGGEGRLRPTDRRARNDLAIAPADARGARDGDLVRAEVLPGRKLGLRQGRIIERLERADGPRSISLIAIHEHGIPTEFGPQTLAEVGAAGPAPGDGRDDMRSLPLVTIDGADARDFDDAVFAEADPGNSGGWHLVVAIADVAHYVGPGGALDRAAYERGNSVYFPDRVVPMLPQELSNGWCSLKPGEDRPCLAADLWIGADGGLSRHRFRRGLMRSAARLTYEQAQAAFDGAPDAAAAPLVDAVIRPLFGAYAALAEARHKRGVLELEVPERRVELDDAGQVTRIGMRPRLDSHRLIEEFMIAANVAAAETLEKARQPCMYRVHDVPAEDKLEALRQFLDSIGLKLAKGQVIKPAGLNRILERVAGTPNARLVNEVVLRSQAKAAYGPGNIGHFGLALRRYAHFTSPIRRYADLLVHRALIDGLGLGADGLGDGQRDFAEAGEHLSMTERRATAAERDAVDRYTAAFLAERVGAVFTGRISGVTRFGLFVTIDEYGADGLVPVRTLPEDHYVHDAARHALRGRRSGRAWRLGEVVEARLAEADPVTGGLILHLLEGGGTGDEKPRGAGKSGPRRRRR